MESKHSQSLRLKFDRCHEIPIQLTTVREALARIMEGLERLQANLTADSKELEVMENALN